ncbi:MAG TPA: O-antigen ligase family protein [Opitutales bacterium]|nr:O-antigen ligase family protein [Opitutales bacterium]
MTDSAETPHSSGPPVDASGNHAAAKQGIRLPDWLDQPVIWIITVILGVVVLAGGGMPVWARGLILILIGGWAATNPPRETPARLFEAALLTFFAIGLLASFLPASWIGHAAWRADIQQYGVVLPLTNATSPWMAAEAVAQLAAGLLWLYLCWNLRLKHESRKLALWGLAALGAGLSAFAAIGNKMGWKYPLGAEAVNFSFFDNRNQSALWYSITGLIAFGLLVEGLHRRRKRFVLAGILIIPCIPALVLGRSRMALATFALGTLVIVVVRLRRDAGKYIVSVIIPLAIVGVVMVIMFADRDTLARLPGFSVSAPDAANPPAPEDAGTAPDFRVKLWHDTLQLVHAQPAGVGLGQFAEVFPQYRNYSRTYQSVRHPDSDWVWLLGETGWAGVAAAALAVSVLTGRFIGKDGRASGPYRHLAAICAGVFLLHSLVDVPGHRFGTWMLAGWLLAIAAPDSASPAISMVPRLVWRWLGIILCVVGMLWLMAEIGLPFESNLVVERADAQSDEALASQDVDKLLAAVKQGMAIQPLNWRPYFQRARAELFFQGNSEAALNDYRIARFLEPMQARVAYTEGLDWEKTNHLRAFAAWREALHREDPVPEGLWRNIANELQNWPDGDDYISILSKTRPDFRFEFLNWITTPVRAAAEMSAETQNDPELTAYTPAQRMTLLEHWASLDGTGALAYLHSHPQIVKNTWKIEIIALAASGHRSDAFNLARAHLTPLPLPDLALEIDKQDEASLRAYFQNDQTDLAIGVALVKLQIKSEKLDDALATLRMLAKQPSPPPFVSWWMADLLARHGKLDEAWDALQPYLAHEHDLENKK